MSLIFGSDALPHATWSSGLPFAYSSRKISDADEPIASAPCSATPEPSSCATSLVGISAKVQPARRPLAMHSFGRQQSSVSCSAANSVGKRLAIGEMSPPARAWIAASACFESMRQTFASIGWKTPS